MTKDELVILEIETMKMINTIMAGIKFMNNISDDATHSEFDKTIYKKLLAFVDIVEKEMK